MSSPQQGPREGRSPSSPEARNDSPERITIWEDTDDLDEILDSIEETWEGGPQTSVHPSRDLGVILPDSHDHSDPRDQEEPPPSFTESSHIINIPEQPDEDNANQCNNTSASGNDDPASSEPSHDSDVTSSNNPEHSELELQEQSPPSTGQSRDLINIPDQPEEDNSNQCNNSTNRNTDPESTHPSGIILPNTPENSELELQELSPPSTGESMHIISIPEQPEDNTNQCNANKSTHRRSRFSRFLFSVGFVGFGRGKVKDVDQCTAFTIKTPRSPDLDPSSPEIRHCPLRVSSSPGDENEETGSGVLQHPTSSKSDGANSPNSSDHEGDPQQQTNHGGMNDTGTRNNVVSPSPEPDSSQPPERTKSSEEAHDWDGSISDKETGTGFHQRRNSADSGVDSENTSDQRSNDQERSIPTDFITEIPETDLDISGQCNSHEHLHTYFMFLQSIGVSAYRGNGDERGPWILRILQLICPIGFALICTLAFMHGLKNLKWACIDYALDQVVQGYVTIGLQAFQCISAIYFVKFAAFNAKNISSMLDDVTEENTSADVNRVRKSEQNLRMSHLALSLGITSVIMAFVATVFSRFNVNRVLAGDPLLDRSFDISYSLFVWTTKNESQSALELYKEYGNELTPASIWFGLIGLLMEFYGNIQNSAIRDLMLLASLVLYKLVANFKAELESIRSATTEEMDEQLDKFKCMQRISKNMTNALGMLLAILHMKNLFLFFYILKEGNGL